jgi:myo-inositol 2-dehydrogenase / D-chiro-inositol 1-dehydrogenase
MVPQWMPAPVIRSDESLDLCEYFSVSRPLGVGFLGAGLVTQAIHVPVLAGFPDRFHIVSVMDVDGGVAERVAARCGATFTVDADVVLQNPKVDVVAVCGPNDVHAAQVIAACQAGKKAVLCEKPLAVSHLEAERIRAAAAASGTHVIVGAMHVYDPAYRAARRAWLEANEASVFTQSMIFLPSNDVFTDQATEPASTFPANSSGAGVPDAVMMRGAITGLAIHNLPLLRQFHPRLGELQTARFIQPFGYVVVLTDGARTLELLAFMGGAWPPHWTLRTVGAKSELRVTFPPSFVLAGSSRAELISAASTSVFEFDTNGYQCQWDALHDAATGKVEPLVSLGDVVDDITYALDLADQVDRILGEKA